MTPFLMMLLSILLSPLVYSNSVELVGTFSGQFSVNQGQPAYTIPIKVAPGRPGPHLSWRTRP